jgi:predicted AAA+ superfamily ATPase
MKEAFKKVIIDSQEKKYDKIIPRDYNIPVHSNKIVSLIGVRRCGKTYILFDIIRQLLEKTDLHNIVYINFEDDRLYPIQLKDLDDIITGYYELYPEKRSENVYFFLDEIQMIDGWEKFVRRIYDSLKVSIFVTGSSSKLLASEIATALRGRTITYEIFPLSFKEYLRFKNIEVNIYSSKSISFILNAFNHYLFEGGFPETVVANSDLQKRILSDYVNLIIYRDVIERYGIKNNALLKHLIKYSFTNIGTLVSFTKLFNDLKSQGFKIGKDTVFEYFSYLSDAYALFNVSIFRNSVKEEQRNPKKMYSIDNGFKSIFDSSLSPDYSKLYENIAFLHLRRQTKEVYYFKQNQEVDFYAIVDGKKIIANISYNISDIQTRKRELEGLTAAMEYFHSQTGYLITKDEDQIIKQKGKKIYIVPLWKWLLEAS